MEVDINYWAVLLAGLSSMLVGSVWYSMNTFGKTWAKLARVDLKKDIKTKQMVWLMASTLVASLITAYVLAHVTYLSNSIFDNSFLQDAFTTGFWLWLGLTATRFYVHDAFEGRPWKLTLLNVTHEFVTVMLMAAIIGLMGV